MFSFRPPLLSSPLIYSSSALPCTLHSSWLFLGVFKENRKKEKKEKKNRIIFRFGNPGLGRSRDCDSRRKKERKKTFCWFAYVFPLPSHLSKGLDCQAMQTGRQKKYIYIFRERRRKKGRQRNQNPTRDSLISSFQVMDFGISAKGVVMGLCVQYCVRSISL